MRFRYRSVFIISLVVTILLTVGASMILAAPNEPEQVDREEALAVLNSYFDNGPASSEPVLAPAATAVPAPSDSPPAVTCPFPRDAAVGPGHFSRHIRGEWVDYRVVEQEARHVEMTFINPDTNNTDLKWRYGFNIYETDTRINIWLDRWGEWTVRLGHGRDGRIIDSGVIPDFNTLDGEKNTLVFRTLTSTQPYALFVNGVQVSLDLSGAGLPTEFQRFSQDRTYRVNAWPGAGYEDLCTSRPE